MSLKHLLTRLEALQKATLDTDGAREGSFADLFHSFLDLAEDPTFFDASDPTEDKTLHSMIEACARRALRDSAVRIHDLRMFGIRKAAFFHGTFFAGGSVGTFFFFEKARQGLLAIDRGGDLTLFSRMTVLELPAGAIPIPGPPAGSQRS